MRMKTSWRHPSYLRIKKRGKKKRKRKRKIKFLLKKLQVAGRTLQVRKIAEDRDKGQHKAASIPHNPFLHDHYTFLRFGLIRAMISPSTGSFVSSTGSLVSSIGRSCRTYIQAKIDIKRGPEGWESAHEACKPPYFRPSPYVTFFHPCTPSLQSFFSLHSHT